jgi:hypothetical protein
MKEMNNTEDEIYFYCHRKFPKALISEGNGICNRQRISRSQHGNDNICNQRQTSVLRNFIASLKKQQQKVATPLGLLVFLTISFNRNIVLSSQRKGNETQLICSAW